MPIEEMAKKVRDRYARAASTGEQMCCPASYDIADQSLFRDPTSPGKQARTGSGFRLL